MYHLGRRSGSSSIKVASTYGLLRRCVPAEEATKIIERCHSSPYGAHYGAFCTNAKIWKSRFFWPTMYKDTKTSYGGASHVRNMGISM
jgi:hypothetical protein